MNEIWFDKQFIEEQFYREHTRAYATSNRVVEEGERAQSGRACAGARPNTRASSIPLLSPQFLLVQNAERALRLYAGERVQRRLSHTWHFLKTLASVFSRLVFLVIFKFGIPCFLFFLLFFSLVDLPQNLHRGLLGLSVGCRGSIDSRLLFERQMKCWICLIHKQMNVCYHSGEERGREGKERKSGERWTHATRSSPLFLPSRTLHTTLYLYFRHARYTKFSSFNSVTHFTYNSLLLFPSRTLTRNFSLFTHATRDCLLSFPSRTLHETSSRTLHLGDNAISWGWVCFVNSSSCQWFLR